MNGGGPPPSAPMASDFGPRGDVPYGNPSNVGPLPPDDAHGEPHSGNNHQHGDNSGEAQKSEVETRLEGFELTRAKPGSSWARIKWETLPFDQETIRHKVKKHQKQHKRKVDQFFADLTPTQKGIVNRLKDWRQQEEKLKHAEWVLEDVQRDMHWKTLNTRDTHKIWVFLKRVDRRLGPKTGKGSSRAPTGMQVDRNIIDLKEPLQQKPKESKKDKSNPSGQPPPPPPQPLQYPAQSPYPQALGAIPNPPGQGPYMNNGPPPQHSGYGNHPFTPHPNLGHVPGQFQGMPDHYYDQPQDGHRARNGSQHHSRPRADSGLQPDMVDLARQLYNLNARLDRRSPSRRRNDNDRRDYSDDDARSSYRDPVFSEGRRTGRTNTPHTSRGSEAGRRKPGTASPPYARRDRYRGPRGEGLEPGHRERDRGRQHLPPRRQPTRRPVVHQDPRGYDDRDDDLYADDYPPQRRYLDDVPEDDGYDYPPHRRRGDVGGQRRRDYDPEPVYHRTPRGPTPYGRGGRYYP